MSLRKFVRKAAKVVGIGAALFYGAPYLLSAGTTILSGASTALGTGLSSRLLGGGGAAPEPQQSPGGITFFSGGGGFGGATGGAVGYSDIGAGGFGAANYSGGGGFDVPASPGISPMLIFGIAGGGILLVILTMLVRR
jgi:hypothetical protein